MRPAIVFVTVCGLALAQSDRLVNVSLHRLVAMAYGLRDYQVSGPGWMATEHFNMTLPPGRTPEILRKLLEERFELRTHRDRKVLAVYELTVAPGGPRFQPMPSGGLPGETATREPGGRNISPGHTAIAIGPDYGRLRMFQTNMARLADLLAGPLREPVLDKTGLTGFYDFALNWSGSAVKPAVENQLGLVLEHKKDTIEVLVVDHADKRPK